MRMIALQTRLLPALAVLAAACGGSAPAVPSDMQPALAPTMTIERFLRAANQNDLDTMASLFGTRDGPVTRIWTREEIDARMFLFASVLRHNDYAIEGEQIVPGRRDEATQFNVKLTLSNRMADVPFTLVRQGATANWLIENICIERVTRENVAC